MPYEEACRIIRDAAKGLAHLHKNDVVHRDLRPENIWLMDRGAVKIMEFGAARDWFASADASENEVDVTSAETVIGQYEYSSPEQAQDPRDADARSDIYALGCVLYHCLAGKPPFTDKNPVKLVLRHAREEAQPVSKLVEEIPKPIDETLAGMLAKEPSKRFRSADEVVYALNQYAPRDAAEPVVVVGVNEQYLEWVRSQQQPSGIADDAVGISPELAKFITWISRRTRRRKRSRK